MRKAIKKYKMKYKMTKLLFYKYKRFNNISLIDYYAQQTII